jgi:hypothetical protein
MPGLKNSAGSVAARRPSRWNIPSMASMIRWKIERLWLSAFWPQAWQYGPSKAVPQLAHGFPTPSKACFLRRLKNSPNESAAAASISPVIWPPARL